jgi:hypothetical protein
MMWGTVTKEVGDPSHESWWGSMRTMVEAMRVVFVMMEPVRVVFVVVIVRLWSAVAMRTRLNIRGRWSSTEASSLVSSWTLTMRSAFVLFDIGLAESSLRSLFMVSAVGAQLRTAVRFPDRIGLHLDRLAVGGVR